MVFSELPFLFLFLPLFFLLYFVIPGRTWKNTLLFLFSLLFYAWGEPFYILLMLFSLTVNYFAARLISRRQRKGGSGRPALILAVIINLALIGVFKYAAFVVGALNAIPGVSLPVPEITLPIGISFYTFQILSYVIDVYRREVPAQKNYVFLGAYLSAFPQLIAGPIVRYQTVAEELENRTVSTADAADGIRRFLVGLGKKVLLANTFARVVDGLMEKAPADFGAIGAWIVVVGYALQIYYDFSGYSDMAIGLGRVMGFHYLENFNYPYIAASVTDFWRRWHISLSTFFRDYVYIPMGGNRVSTGRWILNMAVVWFLTGLWHGASWNFVLWGVYFGVILILEKLVLAPVWKKIPFLGHLFAGIVFLYGWVIFRCEDVPQIGQMTAALFGFFGAYAPGFNIAAALRDCGVDMIFVLAVGAGILGATPLPKLAGDRLLGDGTGRTLKDIALLAVFLLCICELAANAYNPFIYYRF